MRSDFGLSTTETPQLLDESIFVLGENVNAVGGAAKATRLLVEALASVFTHVVLFVSTPADRNTRRDLELRGIKVVGPLMKRGCRWQLPKRSIAFQLLISAKRLPPLLIHSVGLTQEARFLLALPQVAPILLWESTEALPHVKFVDKRIGNYIHRAAAVLAPSRTIERNLRATYMHRGDVRILPFWVEKPPKVQAKPHARSRAFVFIGRLDIDKGFQFLFEAFRQTLSHNPDARLTVCGIGPVEPIRNLAIPTPEIEVRGYVEPPEYEQLMSHCDALVLPSLHEGYPLSLLEACGRNMPVIATTVGSIPEVFENKPCAILVEPRDVCGLSEAFCQILSEDDETYAHRRTSAFALFESLNSEAAIRDRLIQAYKPELSRKKFQQTMRRPIARL